ncbi:MAG: hypothetical protein HC873_18360 [Leptolyngbyaceae cyanobacterium SL_1_1]|nr:hypothetical protein [Leptolyngbyaceae cyanobacterium RM1_1_2]NJO11275.1 hypothetical protein [Leptolyngbyaceae cyanobacterium SL_1_1]
MDYEHVHGWAAEFELSAALRQATAAAGGRAADVQLAIAVFAVVGRAWEVARSRERVVQPSPGIRDC